MRSLIEGLVVILVWSLDDGLVGSTLLEESLPLFLLPVLLCWDVLDVFEGVNIQL